jgi:hypothetical protein
MNAHQKWLEEKYREQQLELKQLLKKVVKLEKRIQEQSEPVRLYHAEVEWIYTIIKNVLLDNTEAQKQILKIPCPQSYSELTSRTMPQFKKHFVIFGRSLKNFIDLIVDTSGPIFIEIYNKTVEALRHSVQEVDKKLDSIVVLLQSSSWSCNLSQSAEKIRSENIAWLYEARCILNEFLECHLVPKPQRGELST